MTNKLRSSRTLALLLASLLMAGPVEAANPPPPVDQAHWSEAKQLVSLPNGIEMAYVEAGNPEGEPLLLLHGYTDSSRVWTLLMPYLSDYRLVIPDQRGHGATSKPECCYSPANFSQDARLLLDAIGIERVAIAGHSMGSMVAQDFAARYPERVSRIVLLASTGLALLAHDRPLFEAIMDLHEPISDSNEFLSTWLPSAAPTPVTPDYLRHAEPEILEVPLHVWKSIAHELVDYPVARYASEVSIPVAILSSDNDELFDRQHHDALLRAYPHATEYVFHGLGHNFVLETPEQVGPVLVKMLARK